MSDKETNLALMSLWELNHLLTCLAEECGEVMELMFLKPLEISSIEYELNDVLAVSFLLRDRGVLSIDEYAYSKEKVCETDSLTDSLTDIFSVLAKIQYRVHKSIRFGLLDIKPSESKTNKQNIEELIVELSELIKLSFKFNLRGGFEKKKQKVVRNLDMARNSLLTSSLPQGAEISRAVRSDKKPQK